MQGAARGDEIADHLPLRVDAGRRAVVVRRRVQQLHAAIARPDERVRNVRRRVGWIAGETDDVAAAADCGRRIPERRGQHALADVGDAAAIPQYGVRGGVPPDRLVATARDADGLAAVVDRRGCAGTVAGNQRQCANRVDTGAVDDRQELQHLTAQARAGALAGRIEHRGLGPSGYLATIVPAGRVTVVAA